MDLEIKRQIIHASGILTILIIQIFGRFNAALIALGITLFFLTVGMYRRYRKNIKFKPKVVDEIEDMLEDGVKTLERPKEMPFKGAMMFYLGSFIVISLFDPLISMPSIAVLAMADSLSTIIGKYFGKHKLHVNRKKSYEGSLTFLIIAIAVLYFFTNPAKAFFVAYIAMLVEMIPKLDDNLTVPISVALLMFFA